MFSFSLAPVVCYDFFPPLLVSPHASASVSFYFYIFFFPTVWLLCCVRGREGGREGGKELRDRVNKKKKKN